MYPIILQKCTKVVNVDHEILRCINLEQHSSKLPIWSKEGIILVDLFSFCLQIVPHYLKIFPKNLLSKLWDIMLHKFKSIHIQILHLLTKGYFLVNLKQVTFVQLLCPINLQHAKKVLE